MKEETINRFDPFTAFSGDTAVHSVHNASDDIMGDWRIVCSVCGEEGQGISRGVEKASGVRERG
ncbi:MAG: hypothetical protein K2P65_02525 [Lachnospiraceae bacterium]|nr:hypothetical protein [Lachnospiraceae bacterium]